MLRRRRREGGEGESGRAVDSEGVCIPGKA
jgi:hypothetical protein